MAEPFHDPVPVSAHVVTLELLEPTSDMTSLDEWIAALAQDPPTSELPRPVADYLAEAREAGEV